MKGASALIKKQLIAFSIASVVGIVVLAMTFLRVPESLGIGRYHVTADFSQAAGLYGGAEVTYLGSPIGKVDSLRVDGDHVVADLDLRTDIKVPAGVTAAIHSRSAVGEQYVDLTPAAGSTTGAYLADGSAIPIARTSYPVEIGPVLDHVEALVKGLHQKNLNTLLAATDQGLRGRAGDLQDILDMSTDLIDKAHANLGPTTRLLEDAGPVLATLNGSSGHIAALTRNLDLVTRELRAGNGDLSTLLATGPGFSQTTTSFVDQLGRQLPPLLQQANPVLAILQTYSPALAQLLSDYPTALSVVQSVTMPNVSDHFVRLTLANIMNPPECTKGFLPVSKWAGPEVNEPRVTPLVYCAASHSDPRDVRGVRNVPCPNNPARREGDASRC
ncbi:MAG TPA: MCE family protein [Nocardioides sp.]|nr:MCE family protein [Nocardioides sp.]